MNTMFSLSTELLLCNISRVLGSYKQDIKISSVRLPCVSFPLLQRGRVACEHRIRFLNQNRGQGLGY